MYFAGNVYTNSGQPLIQPNATVLPGQGAQFWLPDGASPLTVTASAQGQSSEAVVTVDRCG